MTLVTLQRIALLQAISALDDVSTTRLVLRPSEK